MPSRTARQQGRTFVAAGCLWLLTSCNCEDCHPATELELPPLVDVPAHTVALEFAREPEVSAVEIVCTWSGSAWTCSPDQEEFDFDEPENTWFVRIRGPAGSTIVERAPQSTDPGEGWPTSCPPCYPFAVSLDEADFAPVLAH